jgi:hypothetical protein
MAPPKLMKSLRLRQAAACDLRQWRMSERAGQRFTAVSQILIGSQYAHAWEVDFRWSVDGIPMECRNQRQTVALLCSIDNFRGRCSS